MEWISVLIAVWTFGSCYLYSYQMARRTPEAASEHILVELLPATRDPEAVALTEEVDLILERRREHDEAQAKADEAKWDEEFKQLSMTPEEKAAEAEAKMAEARALKEAKTSRNELSFSKITRVRHTGEYAVNVREFPSPDAHQLRVIKKRSTVLVIGWVKVDGIPWYMTADGFIVASVLPSPRFDDIAEWAKFHPDTWEVRNGLGQIVNSHTSTDDRTPEMIGQQARDFVEYYRHEPVVVYKDSPKPVTGMKLTTGGTNPSTITAGKIGATQMVVPPPMNSLVAAGGFATSTSYISEITETKSERVKAIEANIDKLREAWKTASTKNATYEDIQNLERIHDRAKVLKAELRIAEAEEEAERIIRRYPSYRSAARRTPARELEERLALENTEGLVGGYYV